MERIIENIARMYDNLDGKANRSAIFAHFRSIDDSHLWPIRNKFNATQRAIGRLYRFERSFGTCLYGLELCSFLDHEISQIVNSY